MRGEIGTGHAKKIFLFPVYQMTLLLVCNHFNNKKIRMAYPAYTAFS